MSSRLGAVLFALTLPFSAWGSATTLRLTPPDGVAPRDGHIVLLSGDEEYRSEEALPMLAKILAFRHGFTCTVLFALDPDGTINPDNVHSLAGAEALDTADLVVMALRYRDWPEEQMQHFVAAYERGVPLIALRTSTHAFRIPDGGYQEYTAFGKKVLGEEWVDHWGHHNFEATRGVIEPAAAGNPLLRGVTAVFGTTDVYEVYPPADVTVLLRGQVLSGMSPDAAPATHRKVRQSDGVEQPVNDPMMPIAWTRLHRNPAGNTNRILCTTMGAAVDLQSEGLRRLLVNGVYWGLGLAVPEHADVRYVDPYRPRKFGSSPTGYQRGMTPDDYAPGGRSAVEAGAAAP